MSDSLSLDRWVEHVFDHPVTEPAWHRTDDAPSWEDSPDHIATFIADTFERAGDLLARFTNGQLNLGFWYLIDNGCSDFMFALIDQEVSAAVRLRVVRSFVPLFEQIMRVRCSPRLWGEQRDASDSNPLNESCFFWWDVLPIYGRPEDPTRSGVDSEVISVFRRILAIPHDACRESALHGIGHWAMDYPNLAGIVDEFLAGTTGLRPELVTYALEARIGMVQ